jgi:hypothetical protein
MSSQRVYVSALLISVLFAFGVIAVQPPAAATSPSQFLLPFPGECESAWKDLKISIEAATHAKVSVTRFDRQIPQYSNLAGFVAISGIDELQLTDLDPYLNAAFARCYASSSGSISLSNPKAAQLLQLYLADLKERTELPIYITIDKEELTLHFNAGR